MTYDEIMTTIDFGEKEQLLKKYYIEEIKILDWIEEKDIQKILFKDKFEYKLNGEYHNLNGPAIKFRDGTEKFWIEGKFYEEKSEWETEVKLRKRKLVLSKVK